MALVAFTYKALIDAVTDGDTLHAEYVDWGQGRRDYGYKDKGWGLRIVGCNAREKGTPGAAEATAALAALIGALPRKLVVHTVSPDTYRGRLDVAVELDGGIDLTKWLCDNQWAAPWDGVTQPRPVPPYPRHVNA